MIHVKYVPFKAPRMWLARKPWREDRRIILDFNRSLTLIADPNSLMAAIASRIKELFHLDRVVILRTFSDQGILTVAFATDPSAEELGSVRLLPSDRLAKWLLVNEAALIPERNTSVVNYLSEPERQMLARLNVRVCAPLLALNRLTGVMLMCSADKGFKLSDYDINLLQMLMGSASLAVENAFLYQQQRDRLHRLYRAERLAAAGQLAASVAHEIRNPLTSIRSTAQYLLRDFGGHNPKADLVKGVIAEVDRIDRTVDGLLSLTRSNEFKPDLLELGDLIGETLLLVKTQVAQQEVQVDWEEPITEMYVLGEASQLRQLFLNLILNALQAMASGGDLTVTLSREFRSTHLVEEQSCARFSVADTGCGIPAENLDRIFDPFFTTKKGGTGLGLFTSYAIVQQHGAELEIRSQENEGTTVIIHFPLSKADGVQITGQHSARR